MVQYPPPNQWSGDGRFPPQAMGGGPQGGHGQSAAHPTAAYRAVPPSSHPASPGPAGPWRGQAPPKKGMHGKVLLLVLAGALAVVVVIAVTAVVIITQSKVFRAPGTLTGTSDEWLRAACSGATYHPEPSLPKALQGGWCFPASISKEPRLETVQHTPVRFGQFASEIDMRRALSRGAWTYHAYGHDRSTFWGFVSSWNRDGAEFRPLEPFGFILGPGVLESDPSIFLQN